MILMVMIQEMNNKYKILATMHARVPYWLVFEGMEIVYKGKTKQDADNFIHSSQGAERNN